MSEQKVEKLKLVSVTYSITDQNDEIVEVTDFPVSYVHGADSGLFEQVEAALEGKRVGDKVSVTLSPEEAFGQADPNLTFTDAVENVPPEFRQLGAKAEFENEHGESMSMVVTHVDAGTITLDGNHPLAGKTVTFHVTISAIRDASPDEIRQGRIIPEGLH